MRTPRVKLVPPRLPASHVQRPQLEKLLEDAETRRLTAIVAGAGFGKSTLAASVAIERGWAWYLVDGADSAPASFAQGLASALGLSMPEGSQPVTIGESISVSLDEALHEDRVLVLDDVHELGRSPRQLLERLVREAPPELHLVLCSRAEVPFPIERLRGQGQVLDIDASMLSFSSGETAAVIGSPAAELAPRIHDLTAGWPVAVQFAAALLQTVPEQERSSAVDKLRSGRGPLFRYLAEQVLERERPELVRLLQTVALFESFSPELCEALGIGGWVESLADLQRRGFVSTSREREAFLRLHDLLLDFVRETRPLAEPDRLAILRAAAQWFERHGLFSEALDAWSDLDDPKQIARVLRDRGGELFHQGRAEAIVAAAARLPPALLGPDVKGGVADAQAVRGNTEAQVRLWRELMEVGGGFATDAAFQLGNHESQHGDPRKAIELFLGPGRDHPLSLAFTAGAYLALGELEQARRYAERALREAGESGFVAPEAEAHLNLGEVCLAEGDLSSAAVEFEAALDGSRRAGNVLAECSARYRFGKLELARGNLAEALAATMEALAFAERIGFALFESLCRRLRGEILRLLGRLDEASADFAAVGFPLGLGDVHRERGELAQAGAAYGAAMRHAEQSAYLVEDVRAHAGLARVLVSDDPRAAADMAERAVGLGGQLRATALLSQGWIALVAGDREAATDAAAGAAAEARSRSDRPGMAESLELQAFCSNPPDRSRLEEALAIWRELGAAVAAARVELALGRLAGNRLEAERAERQLGRLGVSGTAARAAGILTALGPEQPPALEIQALGGFRVLRKGSPLPLEAWKSKKARDLLKLLVTHRGNPVARDQLIEALWPEQDPGRTANRLSVALSTLRAVLDPDRTFENDHFVASANGSVRLSRDRVSVDVDAFMDEADAGLRAWWDGRREEALPMLEAAEVAYTGDFLEEDRYQDWAEPLRNEARAVYIEVLRALAEETRAPKYFLRIIERDPYDEPAHLGLVAALEGSGAHGEAHRAYRTYLSSMQQIGAEPASFPTSTALSAV